ncbi:MAG TPA: hypothetical protein PK358_10285 [Spirochaetota bacterium]|mgnify:CR=1 FL=1|nr:hypothetical protein [Spirochaetota bacterium]HPJ35213.1 hypothetical protein [Spirochaetota bacterium]
MDVQNISGSDTVVRQFSPEYTRQAEQAPEQRNETYTSRERPVEEGKGTVIDRTA